MSEIIGHRLKFLREKKGIAQKFVAEKIGIKNNTLSGYESGRREPDSEIISKLADFYNVSTDYILGRTDDERLDFYQLKIFDGSETKNEDNSSLYHFNINFAKDLVNKNPSDDGIKSAIIIAFNAFEIRLNSVLIKSFIKKTEFDEIKAFNYVNNLPLKEKIEMNLQMYLDFDLTKEDYYTSLLNFIAVRDKILHGVYKNLLRKGHANKIFDVIETAVNSIHQQAIAKGID